MIESIATMDDIDVGGKFVLVRPDLNSAYDEKTGRISDNDRIRSHSQTIKELSEKGARIVVIAHQGRKGDPDFTSLEQHAGLVSEHTGKKIIFVNDIYGSAAIEGIKNLADGQILLLDNVRNLDEETKKISPEEHSKSELVKTLSPLFDYFILDAFSVCHRSQASIAGFAFSLPSVAGRVLEKELSSLEKISTGGTATFILGGAKPEEDILVLKKALENSENIILTGGVFSLLCMKASGTSLGMQDSKLDDDAVKELESIAKSGQVVMPIDFAVEKNGQRAEISVSELPCESLLLDIGKKTCEKYSEIINSSKTIFMKGPMGKYEDERFGFGTKEIFTHVSDSDAFSIVGGGNTTEAIERFGIDRNGFSHISLAGGALLEYIAGKKLPGVETLKKWKGLKRQ